MTFSTNIDKNLVKALLEALDSNELSLAGGLLDELTQIRESELYQQVSALTMNLHGTLDSLNDNSLLMQTKHDIPDAAERLEYVINATEEASNKTLESAENALNLLEKLQEAGLDTLNAELRETMQGIVSEVSSELTSIMLAQSFQDLTGQVLNRVIFIISSLEQSLIHLIGESSHDYDAIPNREVDHDSNRAAEMKGVGPNVTQQSKQDSVGSQADIDDLLSDLGI